MNMFTALYKNKHGLQDKFAAFWDHVSARFASNKYVVGYDPLNEPFIGDFPKSLLDVKPGHGDKTLL